MNIAFTCDRCSSRKLISAADIIAKRGVTTSIYFEWFTPCDKCGGNMFAPVQMLPLRANTAAT